MPADSRPVLDFWFRELTPAQWFADGVELDPIITLRFGALHRDAIDGSLDAWAVTPRGRLALILLLDQFSRHIHRGKAAAFANDAKAQALAVEGIEWGMDTKLNMAERHFFSMPLMHAEDPELQTLSLKQYREMVDYAQRVLDFAASHAEAIARFGRFPYRNEALGRATTPEEDAFLAQGGHPA